MSIEYTYISDLRDQILEVQEDSIVSKTLPSQDGIKTILFGFAAGQELSEHTSSRPAILHFLSGEAQLTLGSDLVEAKTGTWVQMPANLPHSILAKTEVKMLLLLL